MGESTENTEHTEKGLQVEIETTEYTEHTEKALHVGREEKICGGCEEGKDGKERCGAFAAPHPAAGLSPARCAS